mmetsp:Transcript_42890/g.43634  ORF Transcript_42890/g.43634 Transcript_42890/m.43634 type:complete len:82 (+) Transcript_42890:341-586(+)
MDDRDSFLVVNADESESESESEPGSCQERDIILYDKIPTSLVEGCLMAGSAMRCDACPCRRHLYYSWCIVQCSGRLGGNYS